MTFVECKELSAEERQIKKDYEKIGRCVCLKTADYKCFRKAVYPKLVVIFGPCPIQKRFLNENYFNFTGYILIEACVTSNDLLSKLSKDANYILPNFVPKACELSVLEEYFDVQVVHLKHERTELSGH